jgi:glycosyltransferase involved in cell wall biosynthesis
MNLEVLLSCMYQEDMGIAVRARVQSDLLIINQCDKNGIDEVTDGVHHIRMISSTERGLSKSRNMALENACGDICLICDDDEIFEEGYKDAIIKVFEQMPKADVITFALHHPQRKFPNHCKKLGYIGALKSCSFQIAFRREKVLEKNIRFDVKMGSGTGNGGGEENKFLIDCLRSGLKLWYVPVLIATVGQSNSQWFKGHTDQFFRNRGWVNRRLLGLIGAWAYAFYYSVVKHPHYKKDNSFLHALYYQIAGTFEKR